MIRRENSNSPRGRYVRRHPRKLTHRLGEFTIVGPYQEKIDRLTAKKNADGVRQLRLALQIPKRVETDQDETDPPSPDNPA
jgi:hypothetical protein